MKDDCRWLCNGKNMLTWQNPCPSPCACDLCLFFCCVFLAVSLGGTQVQTVILSKLVVVPQLLQQDLVCYKKKTKNSCPLSWDHSHTFKGFLQLAKWSLGQESLHSTWAPFTNSLPSDETLILFLGCRICLGWHCYLRNSAHTFWSFIQYFPVLCCLRIQSKCKMVVHLQYLWDVENQLQSHGFLWKMFKLFIVENSHSVLGHLTSNATYNFYCHVSQTQGENLSLCHVRL